MDTLMVLIMASLRDYYLDTHWDLPIVKCLDMMKAPKWYYLMVNFLSLYLEMYMEPHSGLMLEQSWAL